MTIFRLTFAGQIKKVEHRQAGDKAVMSLSVCKKNYAKQGDEPTFTWVNVSVWGPLPEWLVNKAVKGALIAGSGEFSMRSYKDKEGNKAVSAEVRATSFDVEVGSEDGAPADAPAPVAKAAPQKPAPAPIGDDEPPF